VIEAGKLKDIREESERVLAIRGDSWSPQYVKNRAAITLELLDEIERLKALVKEVPFKVGDVVREVGDDEPTGEIIQIKEGRGEKAYVVKLYNPPPNAGFTLITYYEDEIELIERES
jgi:hypothetical protein